MSRSGYSDDVEQWHMIMWRGQVASAIRGKRGQSFLRELIEALDVMPEKRLIAEELEKDGAVCALGAVGTKRGIDMAALDPDDYDIVAARFGLAHQLVQEVAYLNDEAGYYDTPEKRWERVRAWAERNLREDAAPPLSRKL